MELRTLALILLVVRLAAGPDPAAAQVPSPGQFLGHAIGERFTPHHRIHDYFRALEAGSPGVRLFEFGQTWEHRPMFYAVIASEDHQLSLDSIRQRITSLEDPRLVSRDQAAGIARSTPAIIWLAFGVHGNEASSSEAAMMVAHWLATSPEARPLLDDVVVIVEPVENPDGRERYVQWYGERMGVAPNPSPDAFEHDEPWPGARTNHYLVDLNRDWAWATQPETRARIAAYRSWNPQVFIDFHEMGYDSSYFFPPAALPINANVDAELTRWLEIFGRGNARAFTQRRWPFFVGETFDLFYPGYGDSWPSLQGAVGMTYEMAGGGRAGLAIEREDQTILTLHDRLTRHLVAAQATVRTAADHHEPLILHTADTIRRQVDEARTVFLIDPGSPGFRPAIELLRRQGIEVDVLRNNWRARAMKIGNGIAEQREFPPGTAVVRTAQPRGALAQTLLEQNPILPEAFIQKQRERVDADEHAEFFDLTGWSVPISHNLDAWVVNAPLATGATQPWEPASLPEMSPAEFAYLLESTDPHFYPAVGSLIRDGVRFGVSTVELDAPPRVFPRGTAVILRHNNGDEIGALLREISETTGARFIATDEGWTGGTSLGSEAIEYIVDPRIGLLGGEGTSPSSFGALWHALDVDAGIPHTVLPLDRFSRIPLEDYRVLVLPRGSSYEERLGESGVARLREWLRRGGTLVVVGSGAEFLREEETGESAGSETPAETPPPGQRRRTDYHIPGAAFRTTMNTRSYLTFGIQSPPFVLLEGTRSLPSVEHRVDNIVTIATENALVSGFVWPESLEQVQGSAFLVSEPVGDGRVITFANDPFFRLFWRGTVPLLFNAVLYSPSF